MFTQQALCELHHYIKATGGLQRGRTADDGEDCEHHVNGRFTGLQTKDKT